MRFSVITPSFRQSDWLKLCIASVADQGVQVEHIIQDAGSDDGTQDWLPQDVRVRAIIEKDNGMYDAINRGMQRAQGEILSYLNCDEQYLPDALASVDEFFQGHPEIDMVFADFVVVDDAGNYLFHRKVQTPRLYHTWVSHLPTFTCATFFRRRLVTEQGLLFDPKFRYVGDAQWMLRVLKKRVRMAVLRRFTSAFTLTGENHGAKPAGVREAQDLSRSAPWWARQSKLLLVLTHRLRRLTGGIYFQGPFSYALYTKNNPRERTTHSVMQPRFKWKA